MKDSILLLHLPLPPGSKAVKELQDAGWKSLSSAVFFLRSNEERVTASIRMFSDKFPGLARNALRLVPVQEPSND